MSADATVVFRVDASSRIGLGHLSRCLALAEALAAKGATCEFACAEIDEPLERRIVDAGHRVRRVAIGEASGAREEADFAATLAQLGRMPDWIVVDHYGLGAAWEGQFRRRGARVLAIDDLAQRAHDCDLLVDHNVGREPADYEGLVPASAVRLTGPRYGLIGSGFRRSRAGRAQARQPGTILVSLGGTSAADLLRKVLASVAHALADSDAEVLVVMPDPAKTDDCVPAAIAARCRVEASPKAMWALAASADLAIGAAGVSALERCVLGLPTICLTLADNQVPGARALAEAGAHWYVGDTLAPDFGRRLETALAHALTDPIALQGMSRRAAELCDGRGAERVADRMFVPAVTVRIATLVDAHWVHAWRNDARVRQWSFDPAPIALDAHLDWFAAALASPARRLLVAEVAGVPVGFARFDLGPEGSEMSVFLDPDRIGAGLGAPVIDAACRWLAAQGEARVVARIRGDNRASRIAFERAGFVLDSHVLVRQG